MMSYQKLLFFLRSYLSNKKLASLENIESGEAPLQHGLKPAADRKGTACALVTLLRIPVTSAIRITMQACQVLHFVGMPAIWWLCVLGQAQLACLLSVMSPLWLAAWSGIRMDLFSR